jgi:hypothetical protein
MPYCICLDKTTFEMIIMTRLEREQMISVLLDLKQPIPSFVIAVIESYPEAKKFIQEIKRINNLIDEL